MHWIPIILIIGLTVDESMSVWLPIVIIGITLGFIL